MDEVQEEYKQKVLDETKEFHEKIKEFLRSNKDNYCQAAIIAAMEMNTNSLLLSCDKMGMKAITILIQSLEEHLNYRWHTIDINRG